MRFVLLASPFVGPGTWRAGAHALSGLGHAAEVADLRGCVTPAGPDLNAAEAAVVQALEALDHDAADPTIAVGHSGAGLLVPALVERVGPRLGSAVFVDAGVPPRGVADVPVAPPAFGDRLRELQDEDGTLPPWGRWWPPEAMAELVPDPGSRARLVEEMPPIPASYLAATVPVPPAWPQVRGAFLAFGGEAYAENRARAAAFGWPVVTLAGAGHLHMVVDPDGVARAIVDLAIRIARAPRPARRRTARSDRGC